MKLLFKQRMFSWFDSYDVYYETGNVAYTVKGQLSWGKCLKIFDAWGNHVGTVKQRIFTFLPKFDLYEGEECFSTLCKEFSFFKPRYHFDGGPGWEIEGDFFCWDYTLTDPQGNPVALISKELWNWTDTYSIEVFDPNNALSALMSVIAIDAVQEQQDN
ncbi:MAG: LURP-one-related family protein [Clostridia bacterium]|nr:LURP-one-related family protein [Clostridia bacterium]